MTQVVEAVAQIPKQIHDWGLVMGIARPSYVTTQFLAAFEAFLRLVIQCQSQYWHKWGHLCA
jgi:hypothetical protein